jgi:phospholipid-binding lipoprotein MlaA
MSAARWLLLGAVATAGLLSGCATVNPNSSPGTDASAARPADAGTANPVDPWENWNRKVYAFNDKLDTAVLKPVAETYRDVVPKLVRTGVSNVLGNIGDAWSAVNQVLQGKVGTGIEMAARVVTNTLIGFGGILDPATEFRLTRRSEDFGQTLGRWGVGSGPYVVLPLLGPSTVRDTAGFLVDRQVAASTLPPTWKGQTSVAAVELVDTRTNLLGATQLLDQVALDKYSFVRDAYLQRRRDALYDGAPPMDDEFKDEPASDAPSATKLDGKPAAARPGAAAAPAGTAAAPAAAAPAAASSPSK